jgi:hypothetical protein
MYDLMSYTLFYINYLVQIIVSYISSYKKCTIKYKLGDHMWAIPFNVHTPLWTRSIKFEPQRKKDQSADTNTPQKLINFCLTSQKKTQRSKDADAHNPSEMAFSNPFRNSRP